MPEYLVPADKSPYASNAVGSATFTIGTEAGNAITVNVQLKSQQLTDLAKRAKVDWYLAGDANGDSLASAVDSVAAGTDGVVRETVTGLCGFAVSEVDGDIDFVITEANATPTVYLAIVLPDGSLVVSNAITFA